jgi:hypothetical protein
MRSSEAAHPQFPGQESLDRDGRLCRQFRGIRAEEKSDEGWVGAIFDTPFSRFQ